MCKKGKLKKIISDLLREDQNSFAFDGLLESFYHLFQCNLLNPSANLNHFQEIKLLQAV